MIFRLAIFILFSFSSLVLGEVEIPSISTLSHDSIHCEVGHNFNGGTRGVIHLWKKHETGEAVFLPDAPYDVMWYGEYDYVQIDSSWYIEDGEDPSQNKLFGINDTGYFNQDSTSCTLIFDKNNFKVTKRIQPLSKNSLSGVTDYPVIKVTYTIKNTSSLARNFTIYHADDYSFGGIDRINYPGYFDQTLAYKKGIYDSLSVSSLIPSSETNCIISKLNCNSSIQKQYYTFLGIVDSIAQFYVNDANKVIFRNFSIGDDILSTKQISVGIKYNIGTLNPGQEKKVWFYLGVSKTWNGINTLADKVLESGSAELTLVPSELSPTEKEQEYSATVRIENNSELNMSITDLSYIPGYTADFISITEKGSGNSIVGKEITPFSYLECTVDISQPNDYDNVVDISIKYEGEGGNSGIKTLPITITRKSPFTKDFVLKTNAINYFDTSIKIDGKVDDQNRGNSFLDTTFYYDNDTLAMNKIGSFPLENIVTEFTDKEIEIPSNWQPGTVHKLYFISKDEANQKGHFERPFEFDTLTVVVKPAVSNLIPTSGEFKDPIPIIANAGEYDSLFIYWAPTINSDTWDLIYNGIESTYNWNSELNENTVFLKAKVKKTDIASEWYFTQTPFLIDNILPITNTSFNNQNTWLNIPAIIKFHRNDTGSGFDNNGATYYSYDDTYPSNILEWPLELIRNENFNGNVKYYSQDDAGNKGTVKHFRLKLDFDKPQIDINGGFADFNMNSTGDYQISLSILDNFSGLKNDSTILSYRYDDGETISINLPSPYNYFIPEPENTWLSMKNSFLHISVQAVDSALNKQVFSYDEFIQAINNPPVFVDEIPNQTIQKLEQFVPINLNEYISDENVDSLEWSITQSNNNFDIEFSQNNNFNIIAQNPLYVGIDTIFFHAEDFQNLSADDTAIYKITSYNYPPVISGLIGQSVGFGETFNSFDLDDFVNDNDNDDSELIWTSNASYPPLHIEVNETTHICSVFTDNSNIAFNQSVTFEVVDPEGKSDSKEILFKRGNYPITVHEIDNQTIYEDSKFLKFDIDNFVSSTTPLSGWDFKYSKDSINFYTTDPQNKFSINNKNKTDSIEIICKSDSSGFTYLSFTAENTDGFRDSTISKYTVIPVNDSPFFTDSISQIVSHGDTITSFDLYDFAGDKENPNGPFSFNANGFQNKFTVNIDTMTSHHAYVSIVNNTPFYNGIVSDTILFKVFDNYSDNGSAKFFFQINADTLNLRINDQTILENGNFTNYQLSDILSNYALPLNQISWVWQKIEGDSIATVILDIANGILKIDKINSITAGFEKLEFSVYDSAMNQTAKDTLSLQINPINYPPNINLTPSEGLTIFKGENYFEIREMEISDNNTPINNITTNYKWLSNQNYFEVNPNSFANDTILVKNNMGDNWIGKDTLLITADDNEGGNDSIYCTYEVLFSNTPPVLSTIEPIYFYKNSIDTLLYLDQFAEDLETEDSLLTWSFTGNDTTYLNFDSYGIDPILGKWVNIKLQKKFFGTKQIKFTLTDPFFAFDEEIVDFKRGLPLNRISISDTSNTNDILAHTYLKNNFVKIKFFAEGDSAKSSLSPNFENSEWMELRNDSTIVVNLNITANTLNDEKNYIKVYGIIKKDSLVSFVAKDSILFDAIIPTGNFTLQSLSGDSVYTTNNTVHIKPYTFSNDIYKYAYSQDGIVPEDSIAAWEDSLKTTYVLTKNNKLYISLKDSAGNVGVCNDFILNDHFSPKIKIIKPDLKILQKRNSVYPRANLEIWGYDSTKTAKLIDIKSRNNHISLNKTDFLSDSASFKVSLSLTKSVLDTVFISAIDSAGNSNQINFSVIFEPKKHFVITLNNDGINDVSYFDTGSDKNATVDIFSLKGDHIKSLKYNSNLNEPPFWDGKGKNGKTVPGGLYLYSVKSGGKTITGTVAVVK